MINHILLFCYTVIIYELIKFSKLKYLFKTYLNLYQKMIILISIKKISDNRKKILILGYSKILFKKSVKIFFLLLIIFFLIYPFNLFSNSFEEFVISIFGIFELIIAYLIYHILRVKINEQLQ